MYKFSKRSYNNLKGVKPRLVVLASLMLKDSPYDFVIIEGLRSKKRQKLMVKTGKSTTMNSKHLTGNAIDIALIVNGKITWEKKYYNEFASVMKKNAKLLGINLTWGGDWHSFVDVPHFQIDY